MKFRHIISGLIFAVSFTVMSAVSFAGSVDINTADAETIAAAMNGIGLKKAEAIIAYRTQMGPFKSVEDLANVKGIGEKMIEKNRNVISLKDSK